jgi:hypothetical protein
MIARTLTLGAFALTLSVVGAASSHAEGWFPERGMWNPMEARHAEYRRDEMRHDGVRHEEFRRDAFRRDEGRRVGEHQGPARMQVANAQHAAPAPHLTTAPNSGKR